MDEKKYSVDDILLEVGLSSTPQEEEKVDVDALLQNIYREPLIIWNRLRRNLLRLNGSRVWRQKSLCRRNHLQSHHNR